MDAESFIKERVGLFKDFGAECIKELVNGSIVRSIESNEAIAHQGSEATHLGIVLSGTIVASAEIGGERQRLGRLKAGDTFGEAALMTGNPLLADLIAESSSAVLLIRSHSFNQSLSPSRVGVGTFCGRSRAGQGYLQQIP